MGFLSSIFGHKEESPLEQAIKEVRRIIEDEKYQLEMLNPMVLELIESGESCDEISNSSGSFGCSVTNPIPTNGAIGSLAYLSQLETTKGERIMFHRIGAINTIDVFEAVTFSGSEWFIFFLDCYHPRKSRKLPEGFHLMEGLGQFSGFDKFSSTFPYEFIKMKSNSELSFAYIGISKVIEQINAKAFDNKPVEHLIKLDMVRSKLTSFQA